MRVRRSGDLKTPISLSMLFLPTLKPMSSKSIISSGAFCSWRRSTVVVLSYMRGCMRW